MSVTRTNSKIEAEYRARTRRSAELYARARKVIPAGLTHDSRTLLPYPIYAARATGPRKWDVDGNEYVDYFGGHGALLLGHGHPEVLEAIREQAPLGTHWGSSHELEVRWAELVNRLIPCAERVRFTASGTEASHLALRLARAYAGKPKVIRFIGHFHGWHDGVAAGAMSHFEGGVPAGIPAGLVEQSVMLPSDDIRHVAGSARDARRHCSRHARAVRRVVGAGAAAAEVPAPSCASLRAIAAWLLIFDEVITGFRWSRGGAQGRFGITPDMCVLAKIVAGGLPGGAVAGRADIMDQLDAAIAKDAGREKIGHQGTFNANPCARRRRWPRSPSSRRRTCAARQSARPPRSATGCGASWSRSRWPGASTARRRPSCCSRTQTG